MTQMAEMKIKASEDLYRKLERFSDYTATSVSAVSSYLVDCQINMYNKNRKSYEDMWKKKERQFSGTKSLNFKSISVYTSEELKSRFEEMRKSLNAQSGVLIKELVRMGIKKYNDKSNEDRDIVSQKPSRAKFQKHKIKYSLSDCLYKKLGEAARSTGISVSALTSFIITEYLMEYYQESVFLDLY